MGDARAAPTSVPRDDAASRAAALDVERSFLVQAPAGSGKTELLIQRFLALLSRVDRPEQVVAMTFTRKAAGEMRERIVEALRKARGSAPTKPHELVTWKLARRALEHDARHGWQLTDHPSRLAVQTIDAFCTGLAQQAPLSTRIGPAPRFVDRARPLYESAVRGALGDADADDPDWRVLLRHLDNDAAAAVRWLAPLLGARERLLRHLRGRDPAAWRVALEETLRGEIAGELATIRKAFPADLVARLPEHLRYAEAHADPETRVEAISANLAACADAGGVPPAAVERLSDWKALASWLLVGDDARFRKQMDRNGGFPAKGTGAGAAERGARNADVASLLLDLAGVPGLAEALHAARQLPAPGYTDDAWAVVSALRDLLFGLAARLVVEFRAADAFDFTQATIAAIAALGDDDEPSDLLLKLDLSIRHLLIDEFQDTSFTQLDLLRRLTLGWEAGDGRTLFAVGDPMQSIYRFRGAEVGNFLEAQEEGRVAGVAVESLRLERNFRSHAGLVGWVNGVFPHVLPARDDRWRGAVRFAPAEADRPGPATAVTVDVHSSAEEEATAVVGYVEAALREPGEIAILVRARTHLDRILPALRAKGVSYAAVELDALADRQAVRDLAALTHALAQPADRLAWLSALRAPWCGLALPDLFAVARAVDARAMPGVVDLIESGEAIPGLSDDGRERLAGFAQRLQPALAGRGRAPLVARVRGAWLALGGAATVDEPIDVDAADRFFALLAEHEVAGDVPDWPAFAAALADLRATPADDPGTRVQVMTLHKAKGLEFDTVILPGLARSIRKGDDAMLRLRDRPNGLLLAPRKATGAEDDGLYDYLGHLAASEERAELGRLMYVGATRAKSRLHLTASLEATEKKGGGLEWTEPAATTALDQLWGTVADGVAPPVALAPAAPAAPAAAPPPPLLRVPAGWRAPRPEPGVPVPPHAEPRRDAVAFDWALETVKHVGVVAHRLFAQVAREGLATWDAKRVAAAGPRIRTELAEEGVDDDDLDRAAADVADAVENALADARGRWILDASHPEAASEWALAGVEDGAVGHAVLDRTFVADGVRWIVDFKTGRHEGGDVEAFLDREVGRYSQQLERYGRLVRALDARPIRLALYYPLLRAFREWPYAG